MTAEKTFADVCTMVREYAWVTHDEELGENLIASPDKYLNENAYGKFYPAAARMLIDARARMDTKTSAKSVVSAVKRMVKSAREKNQYARPDIAGMFKNTDGLYTIVDCYRMVRMKDDVTSVPHSDGPFMTIDKVCAGYGGVPTDELELPSEGDLKAWIAAHKPEKKAQFEKKMTYDLNGTLWCNAQYLLDMMQALPGCKAYWREAQGSVSILYFKADNGDGILMPVRHKPETDGACA